MDNHIYGIRPLIEAIEKGDIPEKVLIQKGLQGENYLRLFSMVRKLKIPFQQVPIEKLNRVAKKNHQGIVAFLPVIEYGSLEVLLPDVFNSGGLPLLVILDGITDVRNLGAIARSAECAGAHAIVIPTKGGAAVNADAMKTSAGALSRISVCREESILQAIAFIQECGIRVIACDEKGSVPVYNASLTGPVALVVGAEDKGISPAVRKMSDQVVSIPMKGRIASLNVSVATGIILFETLRQRNVNIQ